MFKKVKCFKINKTWYLLCKTLIRNLTNLHGIIKISFSIEIHESVSSIKCSERIERNVVFIFQGTKKISYRTRKGSSSRHYVLQSGLSTGSDFHKLGLDIILLLLKCFLHIGHPWSPLKYVYAFTSFDGILV